MAELADRLRALGDAVQAGQDHLDPDVLAGPVAVRDHATSRLALLGPHTVVALAGATGSGKSSLFNRLAGAEIAAVGVRRPTTSTAQACVWGAEDPEPLLDWVGVPRRHRLGGPTGGAADGAGSSGQGSRRGPLDGLVLLDLPDHDSVESSHRIEVDRLVAVVDLMVWVLDPQKYADAAVHDRYLARLAGHADVMLIVLSQADRLSPVDRDRCLADLRGLLRADGLAQVPVLALSSTTGEGVEDLRRLLAERVAGRRAATARLAADVAACAASLGTYCGPAGPDPSRAAQQVELVPALAAAAGVPTVVRAVDRAYRHRAAAVTGWPPVRWVRRLRPDPLRRLRLPDQPTPGGGRSSLPAPSAADRSRVSVAVRDFSDAAAGTLPSPWPEQVRQSAVQAESELPDALDRAVAGTDLGMRRRPHWWRWAGAGQQLLLVVALAGLLWLAGLFAWSYLQLGDAPVPHVGRLPVPTLLFVVGVFGGMLLALLARRLAGLGGRRRARTARRRLGEQIGHTAELTVIASVAAVLLAYGRFCDAVRRAGDGSGRSGRSGRGRHPDRAGG